MKNFLLSIVTAALVSVILGATSNFARADIMSPQQYLRKLSLSIKGLDPTLDEYAALKTALTAGSSQAFFNQKIQDYLKSTEHVEKMNYRLNELFNVRNPAAPADVKIPDNIGDYENHNAMNALFREMVQDNLSWDTLATGKKYLIYQSAFDSENNGRIYDLGFFAGVLKTLPPSTNGILNSLADDSSNANFTVDMSKEPAPIPVQFPADDNRIAGAVTTSRFFERYTNTNTNKNRKRAAAMFRIFLCDDMVPAVVPPGDDKKKELLDLVRGAQANHMSPSEIHGMTMGGQPDRHGTQPDCRACHEKLDPMGRTFDNISIALSEDPSAGGLFYRLDDGNTVSINVTGLGDMGAAIVRQPKYAACQVQNFWRWFIGTDVPFTRDRLDELVTEFNARDRRVNDFIAYLVAQREFKVTRSASLGPVTFLNVKPLFAKCASCHNQLPAGEAVPDFTVLPIGGNLQMMQTWVGKIYDQLDLKNNGQDRKMPPAISLWQPSDEELDIIKKWIDAKSPDENGKPILGDP